MREKQKKNNRKIDLFLRDKKQKNKRKNLKKIKRKINLVCGKFERKSNRKYDLAHDKNFCPEQDK